MDISEIIDFLWELCYNKVSPNVYPVSRPMTLSSNIDNYVVVDAPINLRNITDYRRWAAGRGSVIVEVFAKDINRGYGEEVNTAALGVMERALEDAVLANTNTNYIVSIVGRRSLPTADNSFHSRLFVLDLIKS